MVIPNSFYQVTLHFSNGSVTNDIACEAVSARSARDYATSKTAEYEEPPVKVDVRRISKEAAQEIVANGGVDWLRS